MRRALTLVGLIAALLAPTAAIAQPNPTLDVSQSTTTATGSTLARTLADRAADRVNANDFGFAPTATAAANRTALIAAIARACSSGSFSVFMPGGSYQVDNTAGEILDQCAGNTSVSLFGAGRWATIIHPVGNNNLFHIVPAAGQPNTGRLTIADWGTYTGTNPTGGAVLALEHTQGVAISNMEIDGAFTAIDCLSCVGTMATNLQLSGLNSSPGATFIRVRRGSNSTTDGNPSENFFVNLNARAGTRGSYTNAVVISDSDGINFDNAHVGFTAGAAILVQPVFNASGAGTAADNITGIGLTHVVMDSAGNCLDFEPLAGFTGTNALHSVTGSTCQISTGDGVVINDPTVFDLRLVGNSYMLNGGNGVNLQAGTKVAMSGGTFEENNTSGGNASHMLIGGTTTYVTVGSSVFFKGVTGSVAYNVSIADTTDHIDLLSNAYQGATTGNVNLTTSGTDIIVTKGVTDQPSTPWTFNATRVDSKNVDVRSDAGIPLARLGTSSSSANTDRWVLQSNGSGNGATGPSLYPAVPNSNATIQALGTGTLNLGGGSTIVSILSPMQHTTYEYSAPASGSAVTYGAAKDFEILDPAGTLATLTITLPLCGVNPGYVHDGGVVGFSSTKAVTALTVNAGVSPVAGGPTALTAGGRAQFICRTANNTWYQY